MRYLLIFTFFFNVIFIDAINADESKTFRIEGHAFSASTLKPLPGLRVQLYGFPFLGQPPTISRLTFTNEGGFYIYEFLALTNEDGSIPPIGYAFAFICNYGGQQNVQVIPLYRSLVPQTVYSRNVYMQVPESVTRCDG